MLLSTWSSSGSVMLGGGCCRQTLSQLLAVFAVSIQPNIRGESQTSELAGHSLEAAITTELLRITPPGLSNTLQ